VRARTITLTAVLAAAGAAPGAHADNALRPERIPTKARQLAERGRAAHNAGDYAAAVAAFKEAYVLAPSPGLLFNIAQAYRLAGNCDEAAWMYRRFLDTNPYGDQRQLAEQHLAMVEKCGRGGLDISVPAPKTDETKVPEPHIDLTTSIDHDNRGSNFKKAGIGVGIGGAVLLAGAGYFAYDAKSAQDTVDQTYKRGGKWADIADIDARGKRSAMIAAGLGIGGGLAVASGVVMFALGHHYEQAQSVAVTPTAHGAQVSLSWGF
jgi:tetratricopeptide (TPR) repeat protein